MIHKLTIKVKECQLSSAKRFGTIEGNIQGVDSTPIHLVLKAVAWWLEGGGQGGNSPSGNILGR